MKITFPKTTPPASSKTMTHAVGSTLNAFRRERAAKKPKR